MKHNNFKVMKSYYKLTIKKLSLVLAFVVSIVNVHSQCIDPSTGLISWWTGDDNTLDIIGTNDGTQQNGVGYTAGMVDNTFVFDGIDDIIVVPDSESLDITGDVTIELWVRRVGYDNQSQTVLCKGAGVVNNVDEPAAFLMRFENDLTEFLFEESNGANIVINGPAFEDSMWHHYAYVRQGNQHQVYADGFGFGWNTFTNPPGSTVGLPLTIGGQNHDPTGSNSQFPYDLFFHGEVDELSIYNVALTDLQIQAIYDAGSLGKCNDDLNLEGYLFWGNQTTQSVNYSNIDGSNNNEIVTGQAMIRRTRVNETEGKIYWALPSQSKIKKSNLNGSNVEDVIATTSDINVVSIDEINNAIYYTEGSDGGIKKCDLNGLNPQTVISGIGYVQGIAINNVTNKLYWTEFDTGLLKSANIDGTNIETLLTTTDALFDLEVDPVNEFLYFSNRTGNVIERVELNGGNRTTLVNVSGTVGAISLDVINSKIYWSFNESGASGISVVDTNGTNQNNLISSTITGFSGLDVTTSTTLSNSNYEEKLSAVIFPNPTIDFISLVINEQNVSLYGNLHLSVYDLNGRRVLHNKISNAKTIIDVTSFSIGMYLYSIEFQNRILKSGRFIKK